MKENTPITVAEGNLYKKPSFKRRIFNQLFWFPFVKYLPQEFGYWLFTTSSKHTNLVAKYAKSYKALELVYNYDGFKLNGNGVVDAFFTSFWEESLLNAHGARNRFQIVKKELKEILLKDNRQKIKILSLASGSARAVIEVLSEIENSGVDVEARFADISREALDYSQGLAKEYKVSDKIECLRGNVIKVGKFCHNWQPDIVEVVGLMDYLDDKTAIELIAKIYSHLGNNGRLMISNIIPNPERRFFSEVVKWEMIYRTPQQISDLLMAGGFHRNNCHLITEPCHIHTVAVASKSVH